MSFKFVTEMYELLDDMNVSGQSVAKYFEAHQFQQVQVKTVEGEKGSTDFVKIVINGKNGTAAGGTAPTLGIIGRLGGIGARPEQSGFVSDGDGALAAVAIAAKLADMQKKGDVLEGDVIVTTHICPTAPTLPHDPVPFMDSPVDILTMNKHEVTAEMDAILSIDTTKGNKIVNHKGFAITPTVKEGYILKVSNDLLEIMEQSTGKLPVTLPITLQDITPYGNGLYHINSILQPAVATDKPVVGVAVTAETAVAGCATGATHAADVENVVRFSLEVAKAFGRKKCAFYDEQEFSRMKELYGSMLHFQTTGKKVER
ncbi:Protein of unknown function [Evansella caseinilytica]|uniref:DUF1177 domain-containing protein n=1 Tax=Evansella caseinilytica TaxID=1503961 RepID=A0A1H3HKI3_9BACI|nr:DUF1177 domain-containing protein [Evansella caseinilytica]SDY16053.1 Protein of unknown function [Evansella caseinilytica]